MYYIYEISFWNNKEHVNIIKYKTWWDLIGFFYSHDNALNYCLTHNNKDLYIEHDIKVYYNHGYDEKPDIIHINKAYFRNIRVYNDFGQTINKWEIQESLQRYKPRKEKKNIGKYHVIFRQDPIPNIHKRSFKKYRTSQKTNKNYYAKLQEYIPLFPNNSKIKKVWEDQYEDAGWRLYKTHSSWKDNKIKKQWMKHI